ncbi:MAG: hypothetical protein WBV82_21785 [Myxococcaceae bacterium]
MRSFVGGVAAVLLLASGAARAEDTASAQAQAPVFGFKKFDVFGYVKLDYAYVLPSNQDALIGSNSGFRLINARLGVAMTPIDKLDVVISADGFVAQRSASNALAGSRGIELRDAFFEYGLNRFLRVRGGQFKAPFNVEELLPDEGLPFVTRSIVSEGLLPPDGYRTSGMSLERQIGLQVASDRLGGDFAVQYAAAVVNGNGPNALFNDNNAVMPVARVAFLYKENVSVGINGFYNPRTLGDLPNRVDVTAIGYGGDVSLHFGGLDVVGMFLMTQTAFPETGLPAERATGAVVQARYHFESIGLEAGARFAYLEPNDRQPFDQLTETSAMVGYRVKNFPARLVLQYTLRGEESGVAIGNDSLDALAQVTF